MKAFALYSVDLLQQCIGILVSFDDDILSKTLIMSWLLRAGQDQKLTLFILKIAKPNLCFALINIRLVIVYTGFRMGIYETMRFAIFDKEKQKIFPIWYDNF